MIIQIDTARDGPDELRRVARLLEQLAQSPHASASTASEPAEASADMFSMFGGDDKPDRSTDEETATVVSELLQERDDDEDMRVTPY